MSTGAPEVTNTGVKLILTSDYYPSSQNNCNHAETRAQTCDMKDLKDVQTKRMKHQLVFDDSDHVTWITKTIGSCSYYRLAGA